MPVTFRRDVLDRYSPGVRLLTYLTEEFDELLRDAKVVESSDDSFGYAGKPIDSLASLRAALSGSSADVEDVDRPSVDG